MITHEQFLKLVDLYNQSTLAAFHQGLHISDLDYEEKKKISQAADSELLQYLQSLADLDEK